MAPALAPSLSRARALGRSSRLAQIPNSPSPPPMVPPLASSPAPAPSLFRAHARPFPRPRARQEVPPWPQIPRSPDAPSPQFQTLPILLLQSVPSFVDMNPLRPPSSSSRQRRAGQVRGAPAALAGRSPRVDGAPTAPADGSSSAARNPVAMAAAAPPTLASLQAAGFPAYWTSSSRMGSSEGMYPPGGFTNFLRSNSTPENSHLVGNTTNRTPNSPTIPSFIGSLPGESNAGEKETINVDEDERTEKRLNWTKDEDIRL